MTTDDIELKVIFICETPGAYCVSTEEDGEEVWLPREACRDVDVEGVNDDGDEHGTITISEKLAIKKGLI